MLDSDAAGSRADEGRKRMNGGIVATEQPRAVAVLGDIDGSGVSTIAVGYDGVLYVKPTTEVVCASEA